MTHRPLPRKSGLPPRPVERPRPHPSDSRVRIKTQAREYLPVILSTEEVFARESRAYGIDLRVWTNRQVIPSVNARVAQIIRGDYALETSKIDNVPDRLNRKYESTVTKVGAVAAHEGSDALAAHPALVRVTTFVLELPEILQEIYEAAKGYEVTLDPLQKGLDGLSHQDARVQAEHRRAQKFGRMLHIIPYLPTS